MRYAKLSVIALLAIPLVAQVRTEVTTTKTTWNGVLVDANCQNTYTERRETTNDPLRRTETTVTQTVNCPVTPTTNTFGLVTSDGRYIRFDNASNARIVDMVRTDRAFVQQSPAKVTVIGMANGDVAVVESLNPAGAAVQSQTTTQTQTTTQAGPADTIFDVRHNGDRGKLLVTSTGIRFEDLDDADHSRAWTYAQIKELKRDGNEIKIEPHSGSSAEFRVEGAAMTDAVYHTIANRIVTARAK
jgi:hypothetical protein